MKAIDFKKAKGQKVYSVGAYNFSYFDNKKQTDIFHITELTVKTAGNKRVTFTDCEGNAKVSVWLGFEGDADIKHIFTDIKNALDYIKSDYKERRGNPIQVFKRRALIGNYEAYRKETPELIFED